MLFEVFQPKVDRTDKNVSYERSKNGWWLDIKTTGVHNLWLPGWFVQVVLGTFHQGGSRSKSKKAGKLQQQQQQAATATAAAFSSDSLTGGQEASPSSGHNQNLTPPPSVTGGWPTSGIFDTRSSSIDINSSRG
jgi:hypothetical protein